MLQSHSLKTICSAPLRGQFDFLQKRRTFSSRPRSESEEADLEAARAWFRDFNQSTIPTRISTTTGSRPGGPGGQLANNTDSKATTTWEFDTLTRYVPKVLHEELRGSRYFARRSNTISIQCATHRNKTKNTSETHKRLFEELSRLYKKTVPGTTDPEQKKKVDDL
ncbi:hypothetical protein LHYA1_G006882 [Lachnellula hyalina]|uniref:Prokaryotic-type class I peptide chain release factors domain-containing protein n=1 Tax=Lachnellula hyalina TaxID=1316788 RepID=A0A8H8TW96_9HELO|nr:uncharacterized protein LHYA1_G006882 [Lachnellula hyalina]TVY24654.1 hypothetical protein LHYA1_G006882 [Lachnellula hyalina]